MNGAMDIVVLGVGNTLFADEGVGVVAAHRLAGLAAPGVEVLDGGTLGLALFPAIADRDAVLLLDAVVATGQPPGQVVLLDGDDLSRGGYPHFSAHQVDVTDALGVAELSGRAPGRVTVVGMVPADLGTGADLSPTATRRLDAMLGRALDVLAGWGVDVTEPRRRLTCTSRDCSPPRRPRSPRPV